jgi:ArsR family transcriptional regulator
VTEIFKALSDETRLRILSLLWNGEMCVCEIEKSLNLTQSNASRHLSALKNAQILSSFKQAQWTYYKLNENFFENNRELYEYLCSRLKTLPDFQADLEQMKTCKAENLCNCKNSN